MLFWNGAMATFSMMGTRRPGLEFFNMLWTSRIFFAVRSVQLAHNERPEYRFTALCGMDERRVEKAVGPVL
ncbi:unnamed protein product [Cylicocyclus nassatus]|uniref:Uncharacterized protein n=1 Tax=Cylicocyclus nassatus TaxID=53992 RepID=A0AA36MEB4_CYLNA|nr:unnamed protein product [Cylicocyclus nassatus]